MGGIKGSVCDYLLFVFGPCLANHIKIILRNFNSKRRREDNFRATIGYYSVRIMTMQLNSKLRHIHNQWRAQEFFSGGGGIQQIQLRAETRENGDLGAVAPLSGVLEAAVIWYKEFHFV